MPEKCTESCPDLARLEQRLDDMQKRNGEDHREIRDRLSQVEKDDAVQKEQYKTILDKLDTLTVKVEQLEAKPGKHWESIVEKAVWAVCAAVIAFLLGRVGL